ncbi:MAG: sugar phosphate isomerase/epimerase [Cytophagaceae bacterium]|nr:sugar phosphate isomerase/epimerase [Cytophagaceae bacterium]
MLPRSVFFLFIGLALSGAAEAQRRGGPGAFFVFNNGLSDTAVYKTPAAQVALAAKMGFDGVEKNRLDNFPAFYEAVKANRLKLNMMYVQVALDDEKTPYDPRLEEVFKTLRGTDAMPWLFITSQKLKPSSVEGDARAVAIIREISALAQRYGLRVTLYPHTWFWLESVGDAIRVVEKVARPNVGLTFNLPHYLATQFYAGQNPAQNFPAWAAKAKPYLFAVSVNGADFPPPSPDRARLWDTLIQPLGEGRYDTYGFLKTFWDAGFTGPVGLQCYNIKQDKPTHLRKSMATWNEYKKRYRAEQKTN